MPEPAPFSCRATPVAGAKLDRAEPAVARGSRRLGYADRLSRLHALGHLECAARIVVGHDREHCRIPVISTRRLRARLAQMLESVLVFIRGLSGRIQLLGAR
jgi:hypothetical protein